jgi:transglutaminase-like putative cysteine protease
VNRRGAFAVAIILLWLAGLGALARRELFRGSAARLAEAALRVAPGATYFRVTQGDRQIGFASTTIDTIVGGIRVTDYLVADLPVAGVLHRASAQSIVHLSRALALRRFDVSLETEAGPSRISGVPSGDTVMTVVVSSGEAGTAAARPDTQRVRLDGPVLLPTLLPLAIALGSEPSVGQSFTMPVFDPTTMTRRDRTLHIAAESLFAVTDSARLDSAVGRWQPASRDTVRAWHIRADSTRPGGLDAWVDAQGRIVQATQPGNLTLTRTAYELAFDNWRLDAAARGAREGGPADDIVERSAIAAGAPLPRRALVSLRLALRGVDLADFDLDGGRQALSGDTLLITREDTSALGASGARWLPVDPADRVRFRAELSAEPLLQVGNPAIVVQAVRIAGPDRSALAVAARLTRWVHDSLRKETTIGLPNALQVLATRRGDCNEHTQLYLALARSLGLPARAAAGLVYLDGKYYAHAWPEVWLGRWVAVDPTFGEFPASAAHLRFVIGGLARQAEVLRLVGNLRVELISAR